MLYYYMCYGITYHIGARLQDLPGLAASVAGDCGRRAEVVSGPQRRVARGGSGPRGPHCVILPATCVTQMCFKQVTNNVAKYDVP